MILKMFPVLIFCVVGMLVTDAGATNNVDLLFLVDSSGSIRNRDFEAIKQAIINSSSNFHPAIASTLQVGILQYGQNNPFNARYDFENPQFYRSPTNLGDCKSVVCFQQVVAQSMTHLRAANTFTATAIERAVKINFKQSPNAATAKKILILITDGEATDQKKLPQIYELTASNNVTVYAVGIGSSVNHRQLQISANGGISNERVFSLKSSFAMIVVLESIFTKVVPSASEETSPVPPTTTMASTQKAASPSTTQTIHTNDGATSNVGLLLLVDSSISIRDQDFEAIKQSIINASSSFHPAIASTLQVGILQYGQNDPFNVKYDHENPRYYQSPTHLGDCKSVACFQQAVAQNMTHLRAANTYTATAIERAVKIIYKKLPKAATTRKILILITDGEATDRRKLQQSYELTASNNVTVYTVGIGGRVNQRQLQISANGGISNERVFSAASPSAMTPVLTSIFTEVISFMLEDPTTPVITTAAATGKTCQESVYREFQEALIHWQQELQKFKQRSDECNP